MSYDQFWHGDPMLAKAYRRAHDYQNEQRNQEMWMQGMYIYDAVAVAISNAFGGKSAKKQKYFAKPIDLGLHEKTEQEKKRDEERELNKWITNLNAMKINWDAKHARQKTKGDALNGTN